MATDRIAEEITGTITTANERGLKLAGEEFWRNVSKFVDDVVIPGKGTRVVLGLDKAGFIRHLVVADTREHDPETRCGENLGVRSDNAGERPDKDCQIRRMNALSTATAILLSGGRAAEIDAVLFAAETLERWVTR